MADRYDDAIKEICAKHHDDPTRMMDIVREVQALMHCVDDDSIDVVARALSVPRVDVERVVSFYSFNSKEQKGQVVVRLCNDVVDRMYGADRVRRAFENALGIRVGETTPDGRVTLEETACIGMCDQPPSALVNDFVVTSLSTDRADEIARALMAGVEPEELDFTVGDGQNAHPLVQSMVRNNIRREGPVIFDEFEPGSALRKAIAGSPLEVINNIKASRLRGRGGAGFPTGLKWQFARSAPDRVRYVVCNADEGEPGTFKDRVVLTERSDLLFEGMTVAGYAIGAREGIVYLRAEYHYLRRFLEHVLQRRRESGLLGESILGRSGFDFDIRIQMGAGSYVCGEETALISSLEGNRGDPRNRPPFPAQSGYLGHPTVVNNVETLCAAARIIDRGAPWFSAQGYGDSSGQKLLSISGDCKRPGVYEVPFGFTVNEMLERVGAEDAIAVQVGGPSGKLIGPSFYERAIGYEDLATGGAVIVFGPRRDLLEIVYEYMLFFEDESCGFCTPCRVGNTLLRRTMGKVLEGKAERSDLDYLERLSATVKATSRCGLGQTSPNPVVSALANFRHLFEERLKEPIAGRKPSFQLPEALAAGRDLRGPSEEPPVPTVERSH